MERGERSLLCDPGSESYDYFNRREREKKGEDNIMGWEKRFRTPGTVRSRVALPHPNAPPNAAFLFSFTEVSTMYRNAGSPTSPSVHV